MHQQTVETRKGKYLVSIPSNWRIKNKEELIQEGDKFFFPDDNTGGFIKVNELQIGLLAGEYHLIVSPMIPTSIKIS